MTIGVSTNVIQAQLIFRLIKHVQTLNQQLSFLFQDRQGADEDVMPGEKNNKEEENKREREEGANA